MSRLSAHGISIQLPHGWEGTIFVPDLPPPAVNLPVMHASDQALSMRRSTFAAELAARAGASGTVLALVEFDPLLANEGLYAGQGLPLPIRREDLHPKAMQVPDPFQEGRQWFFSIRDRAFCLYAVVGIGPELHDRLVLVNKILRTLRIDSLRRTA
jgi:hypothetical protein